MPTCQRAAYKQPWHGVRCVRPHVCQRSAPSSSALWPCCHHIIPPNPAALLTLQSRQVGFTAATLERRWWSSGCRKCCNGSRICALQLPCRLAQRRHRLVVVAVLVCGRRCRGENNALVAHRDERRRSTPGLAARAHTREARASPPAHNKTYGHGTLTHQSRRPRTARRRPRGARPRVRGRRSRG
jgi:hypothetical protein